MMYTIALVLTAIGGINWGLIALFDLNLVAALFGDTALANIVYLLVALSAVYVLIMRLSGYDYYDTAHASRLNNENRIHNR